MGKNETTRVAARHRGAVETPTDLSPDAVEDISSNLRRLLADVFALYVKRTITTPGIWASGHYA